MRKELFSTIANQNKTEKSNGCQCSTSPLRNQVAFEIISHIFNTTAANFPLIFNYIQITFTCILFLVVSRPNYVCNLIVVLS